jgi:c-di-GMP-binding flagellar brake protein YcgR
VSAPTPSRRAAPRAQLTLPVTLARLRGNPIASRTQDLSAGGMRVTTTRPLAVDEVLHFELPLDVGTRVEGQARVMREHPFQAYALRFERLSSGDAEMLSRLVDSASG